MVTRVNHKKAFTLITIQKRFFVRHIVLIFPLVKTVFFAKHIVLIFSLIRAAFFSIDKNIARLLACIVNFKKELNEKLMLVVWNPKRWWDFCMSEGEKK